MNTPSSALNQGTRDHLDTGPLSWVIGEIREALNRSDAALRDATAQDADAQATSLRHAKSFLHQAHGALQIVDIDGLAIITETVEDLLDRVSAKQLGFSSGLADAVRGSYQALIEYLEELLSGVPHQPVRLFPYYRALLEARGAERIHPADLFFPNLSVRPKLPPIDPINVRPSYYARLRKQFEMALLPFLKSAEPQAEASNAAAMRDIIGEIERLDSNQQTRPFWWVMHGLAEAVAAGQIRNEIYVKQLFARINLQIRRLSQGSASIAERLLRDALFFIAKVEVPTPRARQIRTAYGLDGLVPADYESKRYGQIDVSALAQARERLNLAKNMWNRIAGGDASSSESFLHEMHMLADAGAKLNSAPLTKLLRELKGIARHAANARPGDALSLEVATSLLFVENALNNISRLPENFADRADALTARLLAVVSGEQPAQAAAWLADMSREAQQRQTMTALSSEMQNNLRQVEKMLDEFFRDPDQSNALEQLDNVLHQVEGALAVLDQDDAVRTVRHTRAAVRHFVDVKDGADQRQFQQVARNVGALGFFIEQLQLDPDGARKRFSFDEEQGVFQVRLIDRQERLEDAPSDAADESQEPTPEPSEASGEDVAPVQTVEDELAYHQQQSAELAMSLTAQPDNLALQQQLKESLQQIRLDAVLLDNPEVNDRAQQGIEILQRPDFSTSPDALAQIITATVPAIEPAGDSLPPVLAPATDEAIDAELLEIFLTEAVEVLGTVRDTLPMSRQEPHNQEYLTTLRRSFHTLKGSSRMVGLTSFGEAAWSIEQVLNLRLSEARSGDAELYALLEKAAEVLGKWVDDLMQHGRSACTPHALIAAAERVKNGDSFHYVEVEAEAPTNQEAVEVATSSVLPEQIDTAPAASTDSDMLPPLDFDVPAAAASDVTPGQDFPLEPEAPLAEAHELQLSDEEMAIFAPTPVDQVISIQQPATSAPAVAAKPAPSIAIAEVIEFPTMQPTDFRQNDGIKRIGNIEISLPLHNIYLAETDELVRLLAQDFSEWRHEPERSVSVHAVHAAHSLAGSSATVG
ncbi:MAG TPA: Hpt domain-containing protein, partial [Noviherbaspirillum sp.]